ncbi:hypothetical protein EGP98_00385 [bacterium]|nr:hypothetical protein [bacterium]
MNKLYIGTIVSTHGIKGEIRIISNLDEQVKKKIFKVDNNLLIDDIEYKIRSYRKHKNYDMVLLNDYNNINEVLFLIKKKVYINNSYLSLTPLEDFDINYKEYKVNDKGKVLSIDNTGSNYKIIRLLIDKKEVLVPYNEHFIKKIDSNKKTVEIELL